jgi:glycosyltransferase involved in cell wall biosynthesis
MAPLISVIIPTYNRKDLLLDAVRSVLFQSCPSFELIVVDDGSDDGTPEALELFSEDPRFRLLQPARSGMPGAVRNRGVEVARGDLIAFLDSDDIWLPEKLEQQLALFQGGGPDLPLVHGRELWLRDRGKEGLKLVSQKSQRHRREGDIFEDALEKCIIGPSTVLMRRRVFEELGGFREDLEIAEDYELWLRLSDRYLVEYLSEPCIIKRAGSWDQLSEKYGQIEKFLIQALKKLVEGSFFTGGHHALALQVLRRKCEIYAAGCEKRGRLEEAACWRETTSSDRL